MVHGSISVWIVLLSFLKSGIISMFLKHLRFVFIEYVAMKQFKQCLYCSIIFVFYQTMQLRTFTTMVLNIAYTAPVVWLVWTI